MQITNERRQNVPQTLRAEPKTRVTRAAKKVERNDGEITKAGEVGAGEVGVGARASAACAAPMTERTVTITATRATREAPEQAIAE